MATSKVTREDAQEWLESLQQVGEGWYRQLALAIKANAHKALGMERREFAARIGQRLVDPRAAIIELYREGHAQTAIADILGVSPDRTVARVLAEEGLIEWTPSIAKQALETGYAVPDSALAEGDEAADSALAEGDTAEQRVAEMHNQIEALEIQVTAEQNRRRQETKALKDDLARVKRLAIEAERKARDEALANITDADRERAAKEAEAFAAAERERALAGLAHLVAQGVVVLLGEAKDGLREMINDGAVNSEAIESIEEAHLGFVEELNVAKASVSSGARR